MGGHHNNKYLWDRLVHATAVTMSVSHTLEFAATQDWLRVWLLKIENQWPYKTAMPTQKEQEKWKKYKKIEISYTEYFWI